MRVYCRKVTDLKSDIAALFEEFDWEKVIKDENVLVKPNFLTSPKIGVTTNLSLIKNVIELIREEASEVFIGETGEVGRNPHKFANLGLGCGIVNLSNGPQENIKGNFGSYTISKLALESKIVNIPVLKTHVLTQITGCLKNLFGLLSQTDKAPFHWRISKTLTDLYSIFKPSINILDATYVMDGDGPIDGRVKKADLLMASSDTLALDLAACRIVDLEPEEIEHLRLAKSCYPVNYELSGDEVHLAGFHVPNVKFSERIAALLQHYAPTRKILKTPQVHRGALKIKSIVDKL